LNPTSKKAISIILKFSVLILAAIFIIHKLNNNSNLRDFQMLTAKLHGWQVYSAMTVLFILMLLNWFLESLKWKYLVNNIERISLWKSIESVFCGLTWAIFTPNRIGEYGGRIFFLSPRKRVFGAIAMGIGAVGQMVITNVLGSFAILWFIWHFTDASTWILYALFFLTTVFSLFFLLFYFNIRLLIGLLTSISFLKRFKKFIMVLARYNKRDLIVVFNYSLARFAVFTTQYCVVIQLLIPEIPFLSMVMMILILFFIQSALPSLDLLDVGVRAMTATYFFSFITHHEVAIMASTACIWLVNLIIPAILGSVFVFKLNFFGTARN